jgi:hypothetical protein
LPKPAVAGRLLDSLRPIASAQSIAMGDTGDACHWLRRCSRCNSTHVRGKRIMFKFYRCGYVAALAALVLATLCQPAQAQRRGSFNIGGSNNNNNSNNNQNNRNRNRDEDKNKNSNAQQFQNLIQGGQAGQAGQAGQNKNKNNAQQFFNQQGGQNFQNQQKNQTFQQQFSQGGQNKQGNNWQWQKYNKHNDLQKWVVGFNGGPKPFSNDWYKNHPNAWHIHHNDNWEVATAVGVLGWLGWQSARPYNNPVYIYDPVPVQTVIVNGQPTVQVDPINPADWMTLGSYSLMTGSGDPGTRILQLSVDKQGNIRGNYYDMITNNTNNVIGLIDRNTQQVRWTLDTNRQLTFVAMLDQLTQPQGVVSVKLPGGQVQEWQLVRMENAPLATESH